MKFSMSTVSLVHMSRTSIQISIPKPCHESWDRMDMTERGAFCQSCQKEVIDFSVMTDREVIEYLATHQKGCGRFRPDQVDTKLTIPKVDNGIFKWKAFLLGLLPIFAFKSMVAAPPAPPLTDQSPVKKKDTAHALVTLPEHIHIRGTVVNEKGKRMSKIPVELIDSTGKSLGIKVVTDILGHFKVDVDRSIYKDQLPILEVNSGHYPHRNIVLTYESVQKYKVTLNERPMIMGRF